MGCTLPSHAHDEQDAGDAVLPELPRAASPRLEEVWSLATHNAYWVDRGTKGDTFASGVSERLLDQMLFDRARSIEIDVHHDPDHPHEFLVFHTTPGNSLCPDLRACLAEVRAFHAALPRHDPLTVVVELKELFAPNFDDAHPPEDLDRILRDELGALLFTPAEQMQRCPGSTTLGDCVRRARWPSFSDLRGRVLVALIGNWDELGNAQATKDWAVYAASAPTRAAFPMASTWKLDASQFTPRMRDIVTQSELDVGWSQSVFVQVEDLSEPRIAEAISRGAILRADGANSVDDQRARVAKGMQLLQTDTPWIRLDDRGPQFASQTLAGTPLPEPGSRLLMPGEMRDTFAWMKDDADDAWTATVLSGSDERRVGCLRGESEDGGDSVTICRTKSPRTTIGTAEAERVTVTVTSCIASACTTDRYDESRPVGDFVALAFAKSATGTCAQPRSAATVGRDFAPTWTDLGATRCSGKSLSHRGLFRPMGEGSVLFVSPRRGSIAIGKADLGGDSTIDASVP